jgi:hypothetical protein
MTLDEREALLNQAETMLKAAEHAFTVCTHTNPLGHAGKPGTMAGVKLGKFVVYDGAPTHNWIERGEHYSLVARALIERANAGMGSK